MPTPETSEAPELGWGPGVRFHDRGNAGVVAETTDDHHLALARHERVLAFVDDCATRGTRHPGGLLLLQHHPLHAHVVLGVAPVAQ